jgi:pimeloyl-ACP methyl ester carboxylesterase
MQVAGRAGRAGAASEVVVQTRFPLHPLFDALSRYDFASFANAQLAERRASALPPFVFQALLRVEAVKLETALDFLPTLLAHDKYDALKALAELPALVTCGQVDVLTPPSHTMRIAEQLPDATVSILADTGHMIQLERPTQITRGIADLAFAGRAS